MAKSILSLKMRAVRGLLLALVLSAGLLVLPGCGNSGDTTDASGKPSGTTLGKLKTQQFEIKGKTFTLELAMDDDSRYKGLSFRKEIADDGGMLFVFTRPVPGRFVMRECYVPIDLIYVDEDGYVDSTHKMQVIEPVGGAQWKRPSQHYPSRGLIQFVIELKAGSIDTLGIKRGDRLDLPWDQLVKDAQ